MSYTCVVLCVEICKQYTLHISRLLGHVTYLTTVVNAINTYHPPKLGCKYLQVFETTLMGPMAQLTFVYLQAQSQTAVAGRIGLINSRAQKSSSIRSWFLPQQSTHPKPTESSHYWGPKPTVLLSRNKHPWTAADYKCPSPRVGPSPLSGPTPDLWRSHRGVMR